MKALVYHSPGNIAWQENPEPQIKEPTNAIVKILKTTICRTELDIMKGNVPAVASGRIIGHEGMGIITEVGSAVNNFKKGDHVLISSITSCGTCECCRKAMYSHCKKGGWILGNTIDGTQAEYVRIPFADNSLYHILANVDEEGLVMLSDILPLVFESRILSEQIKPGDALAIVGVSAMGLALLITAHFYTKAKTIKSDKAYRRLKVVKPFGKTQPFNIKSRNSFEQVLDVAKERDIAVTIEAISIRETFSLCEKIISSHGHIVNLSVHEKKENINLETLSTNNKSISTSLEDFAASRNLLKNISSIKVDPTKLIAHRYKLSDIINAYDRFASEGVINEKSSKVVLTNE